VNQVAALYIDERGPYPKLLGADRCWGESRDARLYGGPWPVVAVRAVVVDEGALSRWRQRPGAHRSRAGASVGRRPGAPDHVRPLEDCRANARRRAGRLGARSAQAYGALPIWRLEPASTSVPRHADALVLRCSHVGRSRQATRWHQDMLRSATKAYAGSVRRVAHTGRQRCAAVGS
jgi:hypothetical protein